MIGGTLDTFANCWCRIIRLIRPGAKPASHGPANQLDPPVLVGGLRLDARRVMWRAEYDKRGVEWIIPMPDGLCNEVLYLRRALGDLLAVMSEERKVHDISSDR